MALPQERLIRITDADDPRVADFCEIRERDLVGRRGMFIAEGRVVLTMLAKSERFVADKVLVLDSRLAGISDVLERFDPQIPILVCDRPVIDRIAGFPMHRGVLAVGRASHPATLDTLIDGLDDRALVLVCAGISNHDNLGGLFRNAAAFGTDFLCLDGHCCDPLYRKSIRVSVGTALTMPYTRGAAIDDILDGLTASGFDILALSPAGATPVGAYRPGRRTALVVGAEGEGLPESLLKRLRTVRVPQVRTVDSLNVGMAAGIALYCVASAMGRI